MTGTTFNNQMERRGQGAAAVSDAKAAPRTEARTETRTGARTGPRTGDPIPRIPLMIALGIVASSFALVVGSTFFEKASWRVDPGRTVASRDVIWTLLDHDVISVRDAATGAVIELADPKVGGFIHSAYRGLKRERLVNKVDMAAPIRIVLSENGHYSLVDPATDKTIYLRAFGKDNEAAIGRYLTLSVGTNPIAPQKEPRS